MLTEQRFDIILKLLEEKKSVTVTELRELLDASESTVRRDITALDKAGKLTKVFGGAVALNHKVTAYEPTVAQKSELNKEEKKKIAKYAASLITPDDFIYLDAGTTTGLMLEYLAGVRAAFVTNAVSHAQTLAKMGIRVYLIGGELKSSTEAVVGSQAMQMIQMYHFTKGFFGTNGITRREGFTTPDTSEAIVKSTAMKQCKDVYILTDKSKFGEVSSVTFGGFTDAKILTEEIPEEAYAEQLTKTDGKPVSTYVPFRNGLFLSSAASIALSKDCNVIFYGAHSDDAAGSAYPDCSDAFNQAMKDAIYLGSGNQVTIEAPFVNWTKADVVKKGLELNVPYELTWSCYEGGEKPCGVCGTCIDKAEAFRLNGVKDPALDR